MIQKRGFGLELKHSITHEGAHGLHAVIIQLPGEIADHRTEAEIREKYDGKPIILACENMVVTLYFDPHGEMNEHDAPDPILCVAMAGRGFVRIGGPEGETVSIQAGEAVLWPANIMHKVWTEESELQILVFHYAKDEA